ncbi:Ubiquitin-conjugating enzyme e2 [Mycena kentingensis (nom. inval.)]|nr:Ubiquitin-conjugating enzyme e2 [Mycena kentingensis (nom. inval.)]
MSLQPSAMRRLMKEITQLKSDSPPDGIRIRCSEDNMLDLTGIIEGPGALLPVRVLTKVDAELEAGTPYAGGYFHIKFQFTEEFPAAPPKCRFITKIFHPNVSSAGEICVNTLKKDWKPTYGIEHILVTVKCLLIYPNPESALDEEAGKLLLEDYESYCSRARLITSVHATPRVRPVEFDTPSVESSATPGSASSSASATPAKPISTSSSLSIPTVTRNKPVSSTGALPLKASPGPNTNENPSLSNGKDKDVRHTSPAPPAPLGTADSNVATLGGGLVPPAALAEKNGGVKTVTGKRAAPTVASNGAEKRKKALKRL